MKPLEEIRLSEMYGDPFDYGKKILDIRIGDVAKNISFENDPILVREMYFALTQLYYDSLIERGSVTPDQEKVWKDVCLAGKAITGSFYRNQGVNYDAVNTFLVPNLGDIIESIEGTGNLESTFRHCIYRYRSVYHFGRNLPNFIEEIGHPDTLVAVATGAFEPAFLAMDILEIDDVLPIRHSRVSRNDKYPRFLDNGDSSYPEKLLNEKKVLIIDDMVDTGKTMVRIESLVNQFDPKKLDMCTVKKFTQVEDPLERVRELGRNH
ncbi:phosphoribosyltransferase [Candidatus Woesearchaeota archaeon]|jgi:hypoxanthine phosphoribosyltransferase|nr:phosphoribosyltransferase [Candidatus Woesearchaeota archaeon]MBT4322006.1 phosphoribosyltransferase [Candidatus Woesearchaeota archaeon]MBT4630752.1 phosphoribosyltransferase [Candidatus Woesearchaeota archaeon]